MLRRGPLERRSPGQGLSRVAPSGHVSCGMNRFAPDRPSVTQSRLNTPRRSASPSQSQGGARTVAWQWEAESRALTRRVFANSSLFGCPPTRWRSIATRRDVEGCRWGTTSSWPSPRHTSYPNRSTCSATEEHRRCRWLCENPDTTKNAAPSAWRQGQRLRISERRSCSSEPTGYLRQRAHQGTFAARSVSLTAGDAQ